MTILHILCFKLFFATNIIKLEKIKIEKNLIVIFYIISNKEIKQHGKEFK